MCCNYFNLKEIEEAYENAGGTFESSTFKQHLLDIPYKPKSLCVYHCHNGMTVVFDGQTQVPEYQGTWGESSMKLKNDGYRLTLIHETEMMGKSAIRYTADRL